MEGLPGVRSATGMRVRFLDAGDGSLSLLEIEIPSDQGVLGEVHQALLDAGFQISKVELHVHRGRIVERLRIAERDGTAIADERRLEVQSQVLDAVQLRLLDSVSPPPPDVGEVSILN